MLKQTTNKLISLLCAFLIALSPVVAHAENGSTASIDTKTIDLGKVTQLRKGQHAPFAGVLLSDIVAAKLFADLKFTEKECKLRLTRELEINTLQLSSQIEALKLRIDIETNRSNSLLAVKDERIKYLEENWRPTPWYESGEFWFAMGVVGGILITVSAGYAISQAGK